MILDDIMLSDIHSETPTRIVRIIGDAFADRVIAHKDDTYTFFYDRRLSDRDIDIHLFKKHLLWRFFGKVDFISDSTTETYFKVRFCLVNGS